MEDLFSKILSSNWGALEVISCYLIFKGISNMQNLTGAVKELSAIVNDIKSRVDSLDNSVKELSANSDDTRRLINSRFDALISQIDAIEISIRELKFNLLGR